MSMSRNPSYEDGVFICRQPSRTKQSFAKDADINIIVGRFLKTGQLPLSSSPPTFGDISAPASLQNSLSFIRSAREAFERLPVDVRREASVHPRGFEGWLLEPRNAAVAVKHGLVVPRPKPTTPPDVPSSVKGSGGVEPPAGGRPAADPPKGGA